MIRSIVTVAVGLALATMGLVSTLLLLLLVVNIHRRVGL